jgi:hypothetical protein
MPAVLEPELAARILLMLYAGVVAVVDDKSVLTAEVVLIASTYFAEDVIKCAPDSGSRS